MDGQVAVVTGAGEGQGRATALLFASEGARVIAGDISGKQDETAATCPSICPPTASTSIVRAQ